MTAVEVFAPAKINLTLHVTGRRDDGYHLIDSLVVFAPVGDRLTMTGADAFSIAVGGPEAAGVPAGGTNLVLRAAGLLRGPAGAAFTLEKHLPAASGIGGGSSDAAAAVRGCLALADPAHPASDAFGPHLAQDARLGPLVGLGADIPMCLWPAPLRARGVGDRIEFVVLPPVPAVLANPRVEVGTGAVFSQLAGAGNSPMPATLPLFSGASDLIAWLATQRNDLESPARAIAPEIAVVLSALAATEGCGLARMSGSGATCFALYDTLDAAQTAHDTLVREHPDWWLASGVLGDMSARALPVTASPQM